MFCMLIHLPTLRHSLYRSSVLELLLLCDEEFSPSLSSKRKKEQDESKESCLLRYLEEKDSFHQYILLIERQRAIGMMNFVLTEDGIAIDTFCIHPAFRNQGYSYKCYAFLMGFVAPCFDVSSLFLATGKENYAHLHLLDRLHFTKEKEENGQIFFSKTLRN